MFQLSEEGLAQHWSVAYPGSLGNGPCLRRISKSLGSPSPGAFGSMCCLRSLPFPSVPGTGSKSYRSQQGLLTVTTKMACESVIDCERPPSCMGRPLPETPGSGARSIPSIPVISNKQACSAFNQRVESDHKYLWNK